jgi:hypothetical protein
VRHGATSTICPWRIEIDLVEKSAGFRAAGTRENQNFVGVNLTGIQIAGHIKVTVGTESQTVGHIKVCVVCVAGNKVTLKLPALGFVTQNLAT